jgi:hypothetical protein
MGKADSLGENCTIIVLLVLFARGGGYWFFETQGKTKT